MKLFIAVTLYEEKVFAKCAESLISNCLNLILAGHDVQTHFHSELYIDRSRNQCVQKFLESDCTDLVFIDADVGFDGNAILQLIKYDRDIVAGAYRTKHPVPVYPVVLDFSRNNNCKDEETGLVWVESAPTGFMRIKRRVFEDMIKHYNMDTDTNDIYHFFETGMRIFNDGQWWGEDTAFCKKWTDMGGHVMVEPRLNFTHTGNTVFEGNFHEHLMGMSVKNLDAVPSGIKGWMKEGEIDIIKRLASDCEDVVEVGCWKGRSTKEFLESCKGKVYAVDHFNGTGDEISGLASLGLNIYDEFVKNVGAYPNLEVMKGDSVEMAKKFNGNKVDMVFIDAGHTYEDVIADIDAWLPKCNKIIAGHDYCDNWSGVKKAVNEKFNNIKIIDTVWYVDLQKEGSLK